MAQLIFWLAVEMLSIALLAGGALASLCVKRAVSPRAVLLLPLVVLFAALDAISLPMIRALDATITIGNTEIADLLDLEGPVAAAELLSLGWVDLLGWCLQAGIALLVARTVSPDSSQPDRSLPR
jgi:hypothetical protein